MADADELERSLLDAWDRETLAVYADCLQARGDPRGELIALDLEIGERGFTAELATRRRKRLYEWLGGSTVCGRPWHEASFRYGFATDFVVTRDRNADTTDYLRGLFDSAAGPYVRGLTVHVGTPRELQAVFAFLANEPRTWLERLELRVADGGRTFGERLLRAAIEAMPRLRALAIWGPYPFDGFPHPRIRALTTDSVHADFLRSLPALDELDLALVDDDDGPAEVAIAGLPAQLRVIDLSRNEPHYPPASPPNVDIYPLARALALPKLERVRLPSPRAASQVEIIRALLDRGLAVDIARAYEMHQTVLSLCAPHPRLRLPVPRVWPPGDTLSSREAVTITIPTEEHGDDLSLTRLIERLEDQFDDLPANAQAAWVDFWTFLAELPWEDRVGNEVTRPFPAATLLAAVEPLDDVLAQSGAAGSWAQLADKLRAAELPADATVQIRRYWGGEAEASRSHGIPVRRRALFGCDGDASPDVLREGRDAAAPWRGRRSPPRDRRRRRRLHDRAVAADRRDARRRQLLPRSDDAIVAVVRAVRSPRGTGT